MTLILYHSQFSRAHKGMHSCPQRSASGVAARDPLRVVAEGASRAFTLVELMLSVAMAVILMLGISQVFRTTTDAVGVGQANSAAVAAGRAAQPVFAHDFDTAVTDGAPFMMLRASRRWAFRDQTDLQGDRDYNSGSVTLSKPYGIDTLDIDGNNVEGDVTVNGEIVKEADTNTRSHRTDVFSMFCRGLFPRQTGNTGVYIEDMSSAEAYVWYGHLILPDNQGPPTFQDLGFGTAGTGTVSGNPNNFYASQWCLGRVAMLLKDKNAAGKIFNSSNVSQQFIDRSWVANAAPGSGAPNYSPLSYVSAEVGGGSLLLDSRYDLAAVSMSEYLQHFKDTLTAAGPTPPNWWSYLPYGGSNLSAVPFARFHANPYVTKPLDSAGVAQTSPIFVKGCSQFIVDYAGDYLTQDNDPTSPTYGKISTTAGNKSDGTVDFYVDSTNPANKTRRILWYGFPRDMDGDGKILAFSKDVVPLRDVIRSVSTYSSYTFPFEKMLSTQDANAIIAPKPDYLAAGALSANSDYMCAWGPSDVKPKMIRITMTVNDPNGRLADGKTFEYIYVLP